MNAWRFNATQIGISSAPGLLQAPPVLDVIFVPIAGLLDYLHKAVA